jgi:hypothetical protein
MTTLPLPLDVLAPESSDTEPPVEPDRGACPARSTTSPPAPESPLPTTTLMAPLRPSVLTPVLSHRLPELPRALYDDARDTEPVTPPEAATAVPSDTDPLDPRLLAPLPIVILPPDVATRVEPADTTMSPPATELPEPTTTYTEPPAPAVAMPL